MKDLTADFVAYGEDKTEIVNMRPTLDGSSKVHLIIYRDASPDLLYYCVVDLTANVVTTKVFLFHSQEHL